ncbi:hypothetical protein [Nocardioides aromaticivorans]|uniref:hypothetical protein n=1 Tax=Nocardioides aromaticivorans TaxID=200618 RepID=UPI000AF0096F|nr:hypothetical protein [Nocardioides aromaticivorans]
MDLVNPISLRLVIDAGSTPLRGSLAPQGEEPREFSGLLQLMELIDRLGGHGQVPDPT